MDIVTSARDAALKLYRAGYEAHRNIQGVFGCNYLTPEELIELGDEYARRAFDEEVVKRFAEGKEA